MRERSIARRGADPAGDPVDRLCAALADRDAVLILDNCEHVIDAAAALAERLLTDCPRVRIVATSREPLQIPGETLHVVAPLPAPPAAGAAGGHPAPTRRCACSRTAPPRWSTGSSSKRPTPRRSPGSAAPWTGCRSPSSWPPPGCARSPRPSSPSASTTASRCSPAAAAPSLPTPPDAPRGRRLELEPAVGPGEGARPPPRRPPRRRHPRRGGTRRGQRAGRGRRGPNRDRRADRAGRPGQRSRS